MKVASAITDISTGMRQEAPTAANASPAGAPVGAAEALPSSSRLIGCALLPLLLSKLAGSSCARRLARACAQTGQQSS